MSCFFNCCWTP